MESCRYHLQTLYSTFNDEILIVCAEADAEAVAAFIGPQIDVDWHEERTTTTNGEPPLLL